VNEAPANAYGSNQGGIPIGVGFQADNLNPLLNWAFGNLSTNKSDAFYNAATSPTISTLSTLGRPTTSFRATLR
jgi:hypothetical protein